MLRFALDQIPLGRACTLNRAVNADVLLLFCSCQGNVANVVKPNLDAGKAVVHGIDRVLVTGE
jgi:hypothetical protein